MSGIAIMAVLSTISSVIDNPLVKRLLCNLSARTTNTVDDWVVSALYGATQAAQKMAKSPAAVTQHDPAAEALAQVQEKYESLTPEERVEATAPRALSCEEMLGKPC